MPFVVRDDVRLAWTAKGPQDAPALLLLNSIGTNRRLWDEVVPRLGDYRLVRMDTRGHGESSVPAGDYSLEMLAQDALAVLDAAGIDKAVIAGVSLGGMIAMQLALDHPERVSGLVPICTSATMDSKAWQARIDTVCGEGMEAIVSLAMGRFLSPEFIARHPATATNVEHGLRSMNAAGYAGCGAAIRDMNILGRLPGISVPTLVISGDLDTSTPYRGHGEHLMSAISGAKALELHCAHLAPLEAPVELADAMARFVAASVVECA
ncbi:MAG TPA: 3-oxoadipate enol-lactonase [Sphingomonas sp.]|nr:3-oxoadipate enol-lactonase [Sphingomonas sp.]